MRQDGRCETERSKVSAVRFEGRGHLQVEAGADAGALCLGPGSVLSSGSLRQLAAPPPLCLGAGYVLALHHPLRRRLHHAAP